MRVLIVSLMAVSFLLVMGLALMGCSGTDQEWQRKVVGARLAGELIKDLGATGRIRLSTHPARAALENGVTFDPGAKLDVEITIDPRLGTPAATTRPAVVPLK